MSIEIKNRWTGAVILTLGADTLSEANLYGANLCGANLRGADLYEADLCGADLSGADLSGAKRYIDGDTAITLHGPRPILTLGPLGSRDAMMMALLTSAGVRVECGCFCGIVSEFKAAVEKSHAEHPRHLAEYLAVIRMINAWAKVEMKFADQWERDNPVEARHD